MGVGTSGSPSGKRTTAPGRPARFRKGRPRAGDDAARKQVDVILTPTLTIKQQWLQRFLELFLKANEKPEWISTHIKQPAFVTITADQALHSLFEKETEEAEVFKMEPGKPCRAPWKRASSAKKKEPIGFGRSSWMKRIQFPIFPLNHFITNGFSESPAAFSTLG